MHSLQSLRDAVSAGDLTKEAAEAILQATVDHLREATRLLTEGPSEVFQKTANMGGKVLAAILSSAGLALGGLAINKIYQGYEKSKTNQLHEKAFQEMYRVRPEIRNIPEEKVKEYFSIFADLSPDLAKNPFIAANFVERQAAGFGGVGFEEAGQLARTQEQIAKNKGLSMADTFSTEMVRQGIGSAGAGAQYAMRHMMESALSPTPQELGVDKANEDMARFQSIRDRSKALMGVDPNLALELQGALSNTSGETKGLLTAAEKLKLEETINEVNPRLSASYLAKTKSLGDAMRDMISAQSELEGADEVERRKLDWSINPITAGQQMPSFSDEAARAKNQARLRLAQEMITGHNKW